MICNASLASFNIMYYTSSGQGSITVNDVTRRSHVVAASPPCAVHVFNVEAKYDDAITRRSNAENVTLEEGKSDNLSRDVQDQSMPRAIHVLSEVHHVPFTCTT